MTKPERLNMRDKVAIVSLSWGGLGDDMFIHKYEIDLDKKTIKLLESATEPMI